jgi:hypothetical protein
MPIAFFSEMEYLILKFIWGCKGPQTAQTIRKLEDSHFSISKVIAVIKNSEVLV